MNKRSASTREGFNLWLSVAGQGVSGLGHYLFSFAMGLYVLSLTGSAQSYAVAVSIGLLPSALLSPIVGALADRVSKKLLIVGSDALNCVILLSAFFFTLHKPLTVSGVYLLTLLMSVLSPFVNVTFTAAAPRLVSDRRLSQLASYRSAVTSVIQVAAPVLGGAIYALIDVRLFLLLSSAAFGLSAVSELFIDFHFSPLPSAAEQQEPFFKTLAGGAKYLTSSVFLLAIMGISMMLNLLFSAIDALLPYSVLEVLALGENVYGIIIGGFSVGGLLGALYIGRRDVRFSRPLMVRCVAVMAVLMALIAVPLSLPLDKRVCAALLCAAVFTMGLAASFANVTINVFLQRIVPGCLLGRVNGLFSMSSMLLMPVGMLIFGTLADLFPAAAIFLACSALLAPIALLVRRVASLDKAVASLT